MPTFSISCTFQCFGFLLLSSMVSFQPIWLLQFCYKACLLATNSFSLIYKYLYSLSFLKNLLLETEYMVDKVSFFHLKVSFHWLLNSAVTDDKSAVNHVLDVIRYFSLAYFKIFSFPLTINSLMCLDMDLLDFFLNEIHWTSWACR